MTKFKVVLPLFALCLLGSARANAQTTYNGMSKKEYFSTTWLNTGNNFYKEGQYQAAIDAYQRALGYDPKMTEVYHNLAICYAKLNRHQESADAYRQEIKLTDLRKQTLPYAKANFFLAFELQELKDYQGARAAFEAVLRANPGGSDGDNLIKETKHHLELLATLERMNKTLRESSFTSGSAMLNGDWIGSYTCSAGRSGLTLSLKVTGPGEMEGVFKFRIGGAVPAAGSYKMQGTFDVNTSSISLHGVSWIEQPPGYVMVDLSGTLDNAGRVINAKVLYPSCSDFKVSK